MTYCPRDFKKSLLYALAQMPVVVVTGMRQVGKSTLLQQEPALKHRRYISLDDFALLEGARRDPEALLQGGTVTVDEVQRCPELLVAVKRLVDRDRKPGRFLLSGSANLLLLKKVSETLAGRAVYLILHPFTRREIDGVGSAPFLAGFFKNPYLPPPGKEVRPIDPKEVLAGGMPPVCLRQVKRPELWFKGFEQTYLDRDLRDLSQVADLTTFRRLLQLAAFRTGQLLNVSELARDAKLNTATTSRYLNLMEISFVFWRLLPFLGKSSSRLVKSPKVYMSDSGMASYLSGMGDPGSMPHDPMWGALLENYVAFNLAAIVEVHLPPARLFFWNIQGRHEVDFILESGRDTVAIEVKAASRWDNRDLSHLIAFLSENPRCRAGVLAYNGATAVRLGERLWAIPLGLLLS